MQNRLWLLMAALITSTTLAGCAPVIVGAAGALIVDEAMEQQNGDDGLF